MISFIYVYDLEYRSRYYEPPLSYTTRTKYLNSFDSPLTSSAYSYSKYDTDNDLNNALPTRYLTSSSSSRYSLYSTYRH